MRKTVGMREIGEDGLHATLETGSLFGEFRQRRGISIDRGHVMALDGEFHGHRQADAARGSRYDYSLMVRIHLCFVLLCCFDPSL